MSGWTKIRRRFGYAGPGLSLAVALLILNVAVDPSFLDPSNWSSILAVAMPFVLISMAAAPVLLTGGGGIDLSIGPLAGFVNAVLVGVLAPAGYTSPLAVVPCVAIVAVVVGSINGLFVVALRVPSIIATLGANLALSGLTLEVLPVAGGKAPDWMISLGGRLGLMPLPLTMAAAVALAWAPIRSSAFGRNLLATGGDARAAYASGIETSAVRLLAYIASSLIAAVAGFAFTVSLGSGDPIVAAPYTLIGVAGAVLGGVSLAGGKGGLLGSAAGGAALFLVQNLLSLLHVSAFYARIAYGLILISVLALSSLADHRRRRRDDAARLGAV